MSNKKSYHFIAIGGAVMHQLALHLHNMGHRVTGSDDAIYDPARTNLEKHGLLPAAEGWFPEKVHQNLDAVILGMHARADNPELQKAMEAGVRVYSFPEFVYEHSKNKKRIVVAGSHGKTTTTSMIMHVLRKAGLDFDYLVGAQIEGFEYVVRISADAPVIVIEGDEYLTSPLDLRSKFLHYHPHLAIITGIAWDHINVFPEFEGYVDTFRQFMQSVRDKIFLYAEDDELKKLSLENFKAALVPYHSLPTLQIGETIFIQHKDHTHPVGIFGAHNMANMSAALKVCHELGISEEDFFLYIADFKGAAKRMELLRDIPDRKISVYRDFAHAPSKVKATVDAIRNRYSDRKMVTALELHTFSSLQPDFIIQYQNSLSGSDAAAVYVDSEALRQKNRAPIDPGWLKQQFGDPAPFIPSDINALKEWLNAHRQDNMVLLMMSSGHWGGLDIKKYCEEQL
jgi:UDP-N-acetylmuramate: L-alanyl-gamma-D-glutamyl-meso-diaminopimelate ligase